MPTWPASLPQSFPLNDNYSRVDGVLRTPMAVGPAKRRRRATADVKVYELTPDRFVLTESQWDTLESFYDSDTSGGSLPFDWTDPWPSGGTISFMFVQFPTRSTILPGPNRKFRVRLLLEEQP
jgi:hypothetical protein